MNPTVLPSPGVSANSPQLRAAAAKAIGAVNLAVRLSPDSEAPAQLAEFFIACAKACQTNRPKKGSK